MSDDQHIHTISFPEPPAALLSGETRDPIKSEIVGMHRAIQRTRDAASVLANELEINGLLAEFQYACEDASTCSDDRIQSTAKHRAILRNALREKLLLSTPVVSEKGPT